MSRPVPFDGEQIRLDEPVELERDAKLLVTVLPKSDQERESWIRASLQNLERAYGEDEEGYPRIAIKAANPEIVLGDYPVWSPFAAFEAAETLLARLRRSSV